MPKLSSIYIASIFLLCMIGCAKPDNTDPRCKDEFNFQCDATRTVIEKRLIKLSEKIKIYEKAIQDCGEDTMCAVKLKCFQNAFSPGYCIDRSAKLSDKEQALFDKLRDTKEYHSDKYNLEIKAKLTLLYQKDMIEWQKDCENEYMEKMKAPWYRANCDTGGAGYFDRWYAKKHGITIKE